MKKFLTAVAAVSLSAVAMAAPKAAVTETEPAASAPVAEVSTPVVVETAPAASQVSATPEVIFMDAAKAREQNANIIGSKRDHMPKDPAAMLENR